MTKGPLALALSLLSLTPVTAAAPQTFRASVDFVAVDVSVRQSGRAVTDLRAGDFVLLDGGMPQRLEDAGREVLPIDVTFIVDWSGSVRGAVLDSLTRAMESVRAQLRPEDHATVVTFSHVIRDRGRMPSGGNLIAAFGNPAGQTSLIDALTVSLIQPAEPGRRRMAIVFTDGVDTTSFEDGSTLIDVASRAETALFIVALAPRAGSGRSRHESLFTTLAQTTGGAFALLAANQDLGASFVRAFEEFRTSYVLRYSYEGPVADGWHPLSIRVTRRGSFEIRARPGYWRRPLK